MTKILPAASQPTSVGRLKLKAGAGSGGPGRARRREWAARAGGPGHHDAAFGIELDDHVGAFVDGPDIVLGVDAHGVSEDEAVEAFADLADEGAVWSNSNRRVLWLRV